MRSLGAELLAFWDAMRDARGLPWRRDESLARKTLVEGLLAQTTASAVAGEYARIFAGIETGGHWLALPHAERMARVAPLGLPRLKCDAVTAIARALDKFCVVLLSGEGLDFLAQQRGIGPYTLGMVALLHGHEAAPVDCNVLRVGARAHCDGNAEAWIAEVVADAQQLDADARGGFAGYRAISAVLDIGANICSSMSPDCLRCPLRQHCRSFDRLGRQMILPF